MTRRLALILSGVWTAVVLVAAVAVVWYVVTHPVRGMTQDQRAAKVGGGMGVAAGIGYGIIWIPYAAQVGQRRRAERARKQQRKSKGKPRV